MNPEKTAIRARGLQMRYGRKRVLRGVDLDVPVGATTVLLGANGEGKTTLLNVCLGVLARSAGEISVLGHDPHSQRNRREVRGGDRVRGRPDRLL